MTALLPLPEWVPPWVSLLALVVASLFALALLCMPFSVFGVKGRLEGVEARLDEIQGEIRSLALRLPEPMDHGDDPPEPQPRRWGPTARPPIPPAPREREPLDPGAPSPDRRVARPTGSRAEPRLGPR